MVEETPKTAQSPIEKAMETVAKLEKLNAELETKLKAFEELRSREILGGMSEAGTTQPKPKEITDKEYSDAALRGIILK